MWKIASEGFVKLVASFAVLNVCLHGVNVCPDNLASFAVADFFGERDFVTSYWDNPPITAVFAYALFDISEVFIIGSP